MPSRKILLIGAGNMGSALAAGWSDSPGQDNSDIRIYDIRAAAARRLAKRCGAVYASNPAAALESVSIVVLAVKPAHIAEVISQLVPHAKSRHLFCSIAAGIPTLKIRSVLGPKARVVRIMPNTPGLIGAGASAVATTHVTKTDIQTARSLFRCLGKVVFVPEKWMDAVTGLSGSGPAYVYLFLESLIEGGRKCGLPEKTARELAFQTVTGATQLASTSKESLEQLRLRVMSPGGTTVAGCKVLDRKGFKKTVVSAIQAATKRSVELRKG